MHNILKSQNLSAIDSAGTYCFPDISKETGLMDGANPKSGGSSFQRIYVDMTGDRSVEIPGGSFVNSRLDPIGHIYPVRIDNIVEWNGKQVIL